MGDKPSDNRRRISDNLLDEIEEFDGKDFSEQLLKWKNSSDNVSEMIQDLEKSIRDAVQGNTYEDEEALRERIDELRDKDQDTLSKEDVKEAVREALPSGVY